MTHAAQLVRITFAYLENNIISARAWAPFCPAWGGTLFLDEVGEMPLHLQVKSLNVLQDASLQRVGGITTTPVDVRVIAATNQNRADLVKKIPCRSFLPPQCHSH